MCVYACMCVCVCVVCVYGVCVWRRGARKKQTERGLSSGPYFKIEVSFTQKM